MDGLLKTEESGRMGRDKIFEASAGSGGKPDETCAAGRPLHRGVHASGAEYMAIAVCGRPRL